MKKSLGMLAAATLALSLSLAAAADITQVGDDLYAGGQPTADDIAAFARAGGKQLINLRPPSETPGVDEAAIAAQAGLQYHNLPIGGAADLTRANVEALDGLLKEADGEKTLLHCASGNRVGALMALRAAWLQGASREDALEIGRKHGMKSMQGTVEKLLDE